MGTKLARKSEEGNAPRRPSEPAASVRCFAARTKRAAILTAVVDYNRRQRMARLARHLGTCGNLMTAEELTRLRGSR